MEPLDIDVAVIARLFGVDPSEVEFTDESLRVDSRTFQVQDGVVLLDGRAVDRATEPGTSEDVRRSFSEEWQAFGELLPEHEAEFAAYFDLVDLGALSGKTCIDLGCGAGRWSRLLAPHCDSIVLVDFSDAIFVARENLRHVPHAVFFRGDVTDLPFVDGAVDFLFSLGVLHHLDRPCLPMARDLMRLGPEGLFYLYYALDNRPGYYRTLLAGVTRARMAMTRIRSERGRRAASRAIAAGVYRPLVGVGHVAHRLGIARPVPLYETYRGKSLKRIEQDAYDRFFTTIEQRVTRDEILAAFEDDFDVDVSEGEPYWHFLVRAR